MPFEFTCPYCFNKTIVEESLAGKAGPCVKCGKKIVIPEPPNSPPTTPEPRPHSKPRQIAKKNMLAVKAIGVAIVCLALGAAAVVLLWPSVQLLKQRRDQLACRTKLSTIAAALDAYAADYGTYPTPVVRDANGVALYSWRVLILPYVGEQQIYAAFQLDEPWNSPTNSMLIPNYPDIFVSPVDESNTAIQETSYMLVTGKGTLFPPSGPLRPSDVKDGLSNTIIVVESANTSVDWASPIDIDIAILKKQIAGLGSARLQTKPNTIGGHHQGGATVAFADGQSGWLPDDTPSSVLDAMLTPASSEEVNTESFRQ